MMTPLTSAAGGWPSHGLLELGFAGLCLLIALHYLRQAVVPVGVLLRVAAATVIAVLAIAAALVLLTAAALGGS